MWTQALVRSLTQSGVPLQSGGRGQKGAGPMAGEGRDCEWKESGEAGFGEKEAVMREGGRVKDQKGWGARRSLSGVGAGRWLRRRRSRSPKS